MMQIDDLITLEYYECPFNRPEYTIGIPGLIDGKRMLFSINDDYSIGHI